MASRICSDSAEENEVFNASNTKAKHTKTETLVAATGTGESSDKNEADLLAVAVTSGGHAWQHRCVHTQKYSATCSAVKPRALRAEGFAPMSSMAWYWALLPKAAA